LNHGSTCCRTKRILEKTAEIFLIFSLLILVAFPTPVEAQVDTSREDSLVKDALQYIETNRKGTTQIQLIDEATGKPVTRSQVQYQQTSHDFIFSTHFAGGLYRAMKMLGLEWSGDVRLSWADIQPTKGTYDYSKPDRQISMLRQNQTVRLWGRFMGLLIDWNYIESPRPPSFADIDHISDPAVFSQYKDLVYEFVFNVVTHYKGTFLAYMTQIEVNWPDDAMKYKLCTRRLWTVEQAVELDKVVANAVRRADPNAIIMLGTSTASKGASGRGVDALQFARMCLQSGVDVDMVAVEAYPFDGSPAFFYDYVKELAKLGKPVFINETGFPSAKPSADESWLNSWKWHTFNEHVQALWVRYIFTLAFGMKEVAGVCLLNIIDGDPGSLYSTVVSPLFETMGVLTVARQPKESFGMLCELMANFTTSGQARTDDNGILTLRGFAGEYSIKVSGYEPIFDQIRVSEGKLERVTIRVVRLKTPEYNDASAIVASAQSNLSKLSASNLQSQEAKDLAQQAATEYRLALEALNRWELDSARTHARKSMQLAEQALQMQQQQDYFRLSAILVPIALVVGLAVVFLVRSRYKGGK